MDTSTHITCPGCNKQLARPAISEPKNVRCKQCGTTFRIAPEEIIVAEVVKLPSEPMPHAGSLFPAEPQTQPSSLFPAEPQTPSGSLFPSDPYAAAYQAEASAHSIAPPPKASSSNGRIVWVLGALLTVVFLVALIIAGAIWFWYSLSQKPQVAQNGPNNQVIDSRTFQPRQARPPQTQPNQTQPPQIQPPPIQPPRAQIPQAQQRQPRETNTPVPNSVVSYDFVAGSRYTYGFSYEMEIGQRDSSITGTNFLTKEDRVGRDRLGYDVYCYGDSLTPSLMGDQDVSGNFDGKITLNASNQPIIRPTLRTRNLPFLFVALPYVGIEPLPSTGKQEWEERKTISTSIPKLNEKSLTRDTNRDTSPRYSDPFQQDPFVRDLLDEYGIPEPLLHRSANEIAERIQEDFQELSRNRGIGRNRGTRRSGRVPDPLFSDPLNRDPLNRNPLGSNPYDNLGIPEPPSYRSARDIIDRVQGNRGSRSNRGTRGLANDPLDPFGGRTSRRNDEPEMLSCTLLHVTKYRVLSEDADNVRISKEVSVTTQTSKNDAVKLSTTSRGYYVFSKSKRCVTELKMEGKTGIEFSNSSLNIPHKFNYSLRAVETREELAAAQKKRREEAQKKIDEARERNANSSTLSPQRITANVGESKALPQNVVASFGEMGWGIDSMAFSPNNNFLVCGHPDRKLSVYDVEREQQVDLHEKLEGLGQIKVIAINQDGNQVLTGGYSGRIAIWNLDDSGKLERIGEFNGHEVEVKSMAIDPTGQYVISGDRNKTARLWNLETQREIAASTDFSYHVVGAGFTDKGKTAVACCGKSIAFIDVDSGEVTRREEKYRKGSIAHDIAFSPDGSQFAVSDGYEIQVFDTETLAPYGAMKSKNHINWTLEYSSDGKYIISGQSGISIWDVDSLLPLGEIDLGKHKNVQAVAVSPNGHLISGIGSSAGQTLQVYKCPIDDLDSPSESESD